MVNEEVGLSFVESLEVWSRNLLGRVLSHTVCFAVSLDSSETVEVHPPFCVCTAERPRSAAHHASRVYTFLRSKHKQAWLMEGNFPGVLTRATLFSSFRRVEQKKKL